VREVLEEALREDPLFDDVSNGRKLRRERAPLPGDRLQIGIGGVPPAVQRQRTHAARIAGAQGMATAAPSDTPATWACSIPIVPRNEATGSA
jgi:hypothetical protein